MSCLFLGPSKSGLQTLFPPVFKTTQGTNKYDCPYPVSLCTDTLRSTLSFHSPLEVRWPWTLPHPMHLRGVSTARYSTKLPLEEARKSALQVTTHPRHLRNDKKKSRPDSERAGLSVLSWCFFSGGPTSRLWTRSDPCPRLGYQKSGVFPYHLHRPPQVLRAQVTGCSTST
ncbi:hypothetical protein BDP81DRAFT_124067 [Colletotrichum phormii]|uniref:Uncharacterized protein n=1 Tax=Colletotrichum phormii TaxID=359342 RepID=A0AAI9ZZW8_9PEZI|nr:uncharacterized protein BDP81DRAFT_124067 [Colletotrichum phormii]KAK1640875.1 hypothetical protein BDP81DRAFT_124067 [Colletotrichum phormii]